MKSFFKQNLIPFLSLFTSLGTLMCCALPALLVTLGMGAAMAGLVSAAPWIVWLSDYKPIVFAVSGVILAFAAFIQWRARNAPCPPDPQQARVCGIMRKVSWWVIGFSSAIYAMGFFFAFLAVHFL
ncbi:MAG: hypothetical protein GC137_02920 [Alphaproteobacteria bacterium]|nr:hypothetical protein [Alphaproteobacteria bacterium]